MDYLSWLNQDKSYQKQLLDVPIEDLRNKLINRDVFRFGEFYK